MNHEASKADSLNRMRTEKWRVGNAPSPEQLVRRLQAAVLQHDSATLDALVAPEFGLTGSAPLGLLDKPGWIAAALDFSWRSFDFEEIQTVDLVKTAVVVSKLRQAGTWAGQPIDGRFLLVDVWRAADAGWQLTSRYAERLAGSSNDAP